MTAVEVHGLAQRVAAMGLKEFDDAGLPHVSLKHVVGVHSQGWGRKCAATEYH